MGTQNRPAWGYINAQGEIMIEAEFESAGQFSEGMAAVYDYDYRG